MINHKLVEEELNKEEKKILELIKQDYYDKMSIDKKKCVDDLINLSDVVIVNTGLRRPNDYDTFAHSGRSLKDDRIHFYPDVRNFSSDEEAIQVCKGILPHESFHFFIQPDKLKFESRQEREMAMFYTEGLVEKVSRIFYENHKSEISFRPASYGVNMNFVDRIQEDLAATSYEVIFSETPYLKEIGKYKGIYDKIQEETRKKLEKRRKQEETQKQKNNDVEEER